MPKILIDPRPADDFRLGHQPGAISMPAPIMEKYGKFFFDKEDSLEMVEAADNLETTPSISAQDYLALETDHQLLDVRSFEEITRHAPQEHLVSIPLEELKQNYQKLDPEKEIYIVCGSGGRATMAASFLKLQGIEASVVEGGMKALSQELN